MKLLKITKVAKFGNRTKRNQSEEINGWEREGRVRQSKSDKQGGESEIETKENEYEGSYFSTLFTSYLFLFVFFSAFLLSNAFLCLNFLVFLSLTDFLCVTRTPAFLTSVYKSIYFLPPDFLKFFSFSPYNFQFMSLAFWLFHHILYL